MMGIAEACGHAYPTTCRIVQTLIHEGLIERESERKRYRATALVQTLSSGYHGQNRLVQAARQEIVKLTSNHRMAVAVVTHVGPHMVVSDSTHALTSLTFSNYHPGYTLAILDCASGLAYLAFAAPGREQQRSQKLGFPARRQPADASSASDWRPARGNLSAMATPPREETASRQIRAKLRLWPFPFSKAASWPAC
ncbi:MAG: hypothetical protein WDN76_08110 [Alphaproteobacteria bacterium]